MLAVENKYTEGVELLMKYATKQTNNKGDTALIIAARKGLVEIVRLLCSEEAGVRNKAGLSALEEAIDNDWEICTKMLWESKEEQRILSQSYRKKAAK